MQQTITLTLDLFYTYSLVLYMVLQDCNFMGMTTGAVYQQQS